MQTFIGTAVAFFLIMFMMALGVMLTGRRLRGSCGGVPGRACSCSSGERDACEKRAALKATQPDDGLRHLDVLDEQAARALEAAQSAQSSKRDG